MKIDVVTGNNFSQRKLIYQTNLFFNNDQNIFFPKKMILGKEKNFVINIEKRAVKILLAEKSCFDDYEIIRKYIEKMFKYQSIGIYLEKDLLWLNQIKNVKLHKYFVEY